MNTVVVVRQVPDLIEPLEVAPSVDRLIGTPSSA